MKNLTNHQQQGSGWVSTVVRNMQVNYFVKTCSMKTYGKYVKWPVGVYGNRHIVKVQNKDDCVLLLVTAHFCYKDALKMHNFSQQARSHRNKAGKHFTFAKIF